METMQVLFWARGGGIWASEVAFLSSLPLARFTLGGICQLFASITCSCLADANINGQNVLVDKIPDKVIN